MALCAYFDESGDPSDSNVSAFAIGGCIASDEEWPIFDGKWNQAATVAAPIALRPREPNPLIGKR